MHRFAWLRGRDPAAQRPTSIVLVPAIVMLVIGTMAFRGLASIAEGDIILRMQQFSRMFVVAMTSMASIVVGYTIVRPGPTP